MVFWHNTRYKYAVPCKVMRTTRADAPAGRRWEVATRSSDDPEAAHACTSPQVRAFGIPAPTALSRFFKSDKVAADYLRAFQASGETSERALAITRLVLEYNASHYTAWWFRRKWASFFFVCRCCCCRCCCRASLRLLLWFWPCGRHGSKWIRFWQM